MESSAEWRFSSGGRETAVRVAGNFTVNHSEALREAVLKGLGVALLPTFTVGADLRERRLQQVLREHRALGTFGNEVYAVFLPTRYLSPKIRAFVDFFVERFSPEPYWDKP